MLELDDSVAQECGEMFHVRLCPEVNIANECLPEFGSQHVDSQHQ